MKNYRRANRRVSSEQYPIDNIEVVDHFGWEGVAYDMLGEDWLSVADRYR